MPVGTKLNWEAAQVQPKTIGWEEAAGLHKPVPKQPMPDIAAADKAADEKAASISGYLSDMASNIMEHPGDTILQGLKGAVQSPVAGAEFVASGVGALAQMDANAFANLGIISQEHAERINQAIGRYTDPQTEVGQYFNKIGGSIFQFLPEHAKTVVKAMGGSEQAQDDTFHIVEAAQLAIGLKRAVAKPENTPKPPPAGAADPPSGPAGSTPPIVPKAEVPKLAREGELVPKEAEVKAKALPQPPIEGEVIRPKLPAKQELITQSDKLYDEASKATDPQRALVVRDQARAAEQAARKTSVAEIEIAKQHEPDSVAGISNKNIEEIVMSDPYAKGELPLDYETGIEKIPQIPEGSSISFGNIDKQGTGVSLTRNTVPGEGPYRLTEWQNGQPIKHAPYPDWQSAIGDFNKHANRPDANGTIHDRVQVTQSPGDATAAGVAKWVPPNQRGMIDPSVFAEGLVNIYRAFDNSGFMKSWRAFARPLQGGDADVSAKVKDFANLRRSAQYQRELSHKELDQIPRDIRSTMIRSIENTELRSQLSPQVQQVLDKLVQENEALSQQAFDLRKLGNIRKPYAPHILRQMVDDPVKREQLRKQGFIRQRVKPAGPRKYATFEEGEAAGVEYVDDIKAMADINYQLKEVIYGTHFVNYIKQFRLSTGDQLVTEPGLDTPGYVSINHDAFQEKQWFSINSVKVGGREYYAKDGRINIGGTDYPIRDGEIFYTPEKRSIAVSRRASSTSHPIKVHPDIAAPLKDLLEGHDPNIITRGIVGIKAATIGIIMYNPAFHNLTVFGKIMPSLPGAGFGEFIWNPKKIMGEEVYDRLSPTQKVLSRTWVSDYAVGNYLNQLPEHVNDAIMHNVNFIGGRGYRMDLYGEIDTSRKNILHNISQGLGDGFTKLGDFWHGTLLWDRIADAQMGMYNRFSIKLAEDGVNKYIKEKGSMPTDAALKQINEDAKYMAGEMANTLAGAFGKEDFGAKWRDFLNTTLFSRSYTMSNVRLAEYAAGTIPRHLLGQMRTLSPEVAQRIFRGVALTTIAKDLFLMFGTLQGLNYAMTKQLNIPDKHGNIGGHFAWDNEPGKEMYIAVGRKSDGTVVYMGIPFRAARDISEMAIKPATLWNNKMNPTIKMFLEELTNRDWRGKQIRLDGDTWKQEMLHSASHIARTVTGFDNTFQTFAPDQDSWRNRWRLAGAQISVGAPGGPVRGTLLSIQREQQAQHDLIISQAHDLWQAGKHKEAEELLVKNKLGSEVGNFIIRNTDPNAATLRHMRWGNLYMRATPEQKEDLNKMKYGTPKND